MSRLIDADALIEFCAERWIPLNIDAVNMQPTIQPEKTQLSKEDTTSDLISRTEKIEKIQVGITATNSNDAYSLGMRNGMRWCKALLDGKEPKFEHAKQYVQPSPPWIPVSERLPEDMQYVLLTVRRLNNAYNPTPFISVGYIGWNQHHWWCAHDGDCEISKVEVLAWMPLPTPYTK